MWKRVAARSSHSAGFGRDDTVRDFTYAELTGAANRFANVLKGLGIGRGDRVYSLFGRSPELYFAALGTLKAGAVFTPLFSAFEPEPIRVRMEIGQANVLCGGSWRLPRRKPAARTTSSLGRAAPGDGDQSDTSQHNFAKVGHMRTLPLSTPRDNAISPKRQPCATSRF